jgi:hypothetical protein
MDTGAMASDFFGDLDDRCGCKGGTRLSPSCPRGTGGGGLLFEKKDNLDLSFWGTVLKKMLCRDPEWTGVCNIGNRLILYSLYRPRAVDLHLFRVPRSSTRLLNLCGVPLVLPVPEPSPRVPEL